jgi:type II secretory pathway component GspD/PulD (secretin)
VLQDVEPRTVTVGITLDVTPQIAKDGMITMNIRPTITDLIDIARFSLQLDPALPTQELAQAPVLDVRETDTMVRVRDGETIVIGGLIQNKKNLDERKVPGLGDIPGVGRLFRRTERTSERKELVIFLTPTLVVGHRPEEVSPKVLEQLGLRGGIPEIKPRR